MESYLESNAAFEMDAAAPLILEWMTDGVLLFGPNEQCLYANEAVGRLLGSTPDTLLGKTISHLLPQSVIAVEKQDGQETNVYFSTATKRWYQLRAFATPQGRCFSFLDITESKGLDITERKRREENLVFLTNVSDQFNTVSNVEDLLEIVGSMLGEYLGLSRCAFSTIEQDSDKITAIYEWKRDASLPSALGSYRIGDLLTQTGKAHYIAGKLAVIPDTRENTFLAAPPELLYKSGNAAIVDAPYVKDGRWKFLLTVVRSKPGDWGSDEVELIRELAARIYIRLERARVEEVLRKSEEKYRSLFESIDEGFAVVEVFSDERGCVTDLMYLEANQAFERHSGMRDFIGKRVSKVLPKLEQHWLDLLSNVYQTGEPTQTENYIAELGRWLNVHYARIGGTGSPFIAVVFNDVTERKQREQRQEFLLQLSDTLRAETGMEAVGNRAVHMIAERLGVDRVYLVTLTPGDDNIIVTHEAKREEMPPLRGSYRGSDFPGAMKEIFQRTIVYSDVRTDARLTDLDRTSFVGLGAVGFMAVPIRRGSETMIWAAGAVSTQPRSWTATEVSLFEDAVERTWAAVERARTEEALRASEEKFRTLFDSMDEGVVTIELIFNHAQKVVDFRYLEHNPALSRQTGITSEIIGKRVSEIYPDLEAYWFEAYERVAKTGEPERHEYYAVTLDRWFDIYISRVEASNSPKLVCVYNNITERKKREQQRTDFLGVVSHELKTPVTSAKAFAEVLQNRFLKAGDEKSASLLGKMNTQMDKLTRLISDLLDVTKIEAGKLQFHEEFFPFDTLVDDILEEVQRTTTHTLQKEGITGATLYGDRERIGQVLTNLLTNAIKYSPNASTVLVSTSRTKQEVTLCVQDFGIGIAQEKLPHVFERFFREAGARQDTFAGLGLGLYVAAEIISRQGGRIWVESEKGQGSTFCFSLPVGGSQNIRRFTEMFAEGK